MWITDKFGNPINTQWLVSLYVESDGAGGYEVRGNSYDPDSPEGQVAGRFNTGGAMTEPEAKDLLDKLADLLGSFDPAD